LGYGERCYNLPAQFHDWKGKPDLFHSHQLQ
jgi:hypothetical protein